MGLLDDLAGQGLLSRKEAEVGQGLARISQHIGTTTRRAIPKTDAEAANAYRESLIEESSYLNQQIKKQQEREDESGLLSYGNLTSTNPLVSVPTNLLNFGARTAGAAVDMATGLAGGINVSNANQLYQDLPDNVKDIYQREQLDQQRDDNNAALTGLQNAVANGQLSDLVGYDKRFKSQSELNARIKELQGKVSALPVSDQERALLDSPNGNVIAHNSLLTPLRSSYRDVINQIETNYQDDRDWRGDRKQGTDNFFGSRAWGNDYAMKDMQADFSANDTANADLNKQGQAQRANASFGSSDYWGGWGKSVDAFKGSVGTAVDALQDNPAALIDMAAETAPFLLGKTSKLAFAGDAGRVYADASQDITQRNDQLGLGGLQETGVLSATAAYTGLNLIERNTLLNAAKGVAPGARTLNEIGDKAKSVSSRLSERVSDALPSNVVNTARTANAVLPTRLAGTLGRNAATTAAVEGAVEMGQTQIEESWSKLKTDVDTSNLAQSGVLGAAMGAAFSVPGSVMEYAGNRINQQVSQQVEQELGNQAISDEDLMNPANPDYAPDKVLNRILATEVRAGNMDGAKQQVDSIVTELNSNLNALKERATYIADPATLEGRIAKGEQALASFLANNTPESNPNFDQAVQITESKIQALRDLHSEISSPDFDGSNEAASITRMEEALARMETPYKAFNDAYTQQQVNATSTEQNAVQEQPVASETVEQEASRHLGAPTFSNTRRMSELAQDPNVPQAVREGLRIVSEVLIATNKKKDTGKVSKEVTQGDVGFRGTVQYIDEMAKALQSGDTGRQESLMTQMKYFSESRNGKLAAIGDAQRIANETGKQVQVIKPAQGNWTVATSAVPRSEFEKNNGILVNPNKADGSGGANRLLEAIGNDLKDIEQTVTALTAMRSVTADSFNGQVNALRDGYQNQSVADVSVENYDPVQEALDQLNADERATQRDMSFRDNDPNAQIVENNEGDLIDNSTTPLDGTGNPQLPEDTNPDLATEFDSATDPAATIPTSDPEQVESIVQAEPLEEDPRYQEEDEVTPAAVAQAEPEATKPKPNVKKFNAKSAFSSKQDAANYLVKHQRASKYYIVNGKTGFTLTKIAAIAEQPSAASEVATSVANEHAVNVPTPQEEVVTSEQSTEANQVDTSVNEAVVNLEQNSTETVVDDAAPKGGIAVLDTTDTDRKSLTTAERVKAFSLQNLLTSGFIQKLKEGFNSPLVEKADYISSVKQGSRKAIVDTVLQYTGKPPSEEQVILLNDFMNFNKTYGVNKHIRRITKVQTDPQYNYKHFSDFFLNEQNELDENTATAIAASIYAWVGENATNIYADKKDIGKILGIKNAEDIPPNVANRLATIGTHQKTLAATLGQRAYQSLQLKMLKDVDPSRQAKVEQMLGTVAVGAMVSMGLAQRSRITNAELYTMAEYSEGSIGSLDPNTLSLDDRKKLKEDRLNDKAFTYFIRPSTIEQNGRLEPSPYNHRILKLHENTKGIMSNIFGFTPYTQLPSLEPITELPNTFNEFGGQLPSMVKEALLKQQALEYRLNTPMVELANKLSETQRGQDTLNKILGHTDPMNRHAAFEKGVISANISIERSMRLLRDTHAKVEDNGFYLPSTVWSNFRNGNPAGFNPQGDKIHRAFVSLNNDLITVPLDNTNSFNEDGSISEYGMFLRGLAFRMEDVKINDNAVDKTLVKEFLPQFDAYISSPEVTAAADALNNLLTDKVLETDLNTVSDLLVKWEMSALGLSALMTINARNQAMRSGAKSFDVRLAADSDGLVNGPAITNVMLNSGSAEFNRSIGIFPVAANGEIQLDSVQQMRKDPNAKDPYEQLAILQNKYWSELPRDNSIEGLTVRALDFLDKDYGRRSGAKRALTPFNYGSGFDSVNRANARGTLTKIYERIEAAGKLYQTEGAAASMQASSDLSKAINQLIKFSNSTQGTNAPLTTAESIADMGNLLTGAQELAIKQADIALRGDATTKALTFLLSDYIKLRNGKTSMANTAFDMFNVVYESMKRRAIADKIASGEAHVVRGQAVEVLTAEEQQALLRDSFKYMPTLATPVGIQSKQENSSAIPMIGMTTRWNAEQEIEVVFNESFGHLFTPESSKGPVKQNKTTTLKTDIREQAFETPGVGSLALYIQSHDAFVTYSVMQALQAQNFHDANSTNAYDLVKMAQVQNEAFLDAVTISHIGKAFTHGMTKSIQGIVAEANNLSKEDLRNVAVSMRSMFIANQIIDPKDKKAVMDIPSMLTQVYAANYQKDLDKLSMLMQQHSIHQYATEGGGYLITAAKRQQLQKRKDKLEADKTAALKQIETLGKQLQDVLNQQPVTTNVQPVLPHADTLHTQLLADKQRLSNPKELIKQVQKNLAAFLHSEGKQGRYAATYNELLKLSELAIEGSGLKINIIDGTTDTASVLGYDKAIKENMTAWYASEGKQKQINLRMTTGEEINSKIVTHELIHAATVSAMDTVRANPAKYVKAKESLDKLDRLYEHVKSKVTHEQHPIVKYGVSNVDEFIATGLTYPQFMDYLDTITDIPVEVRNKGRIATAFRSMVSGILDALYAVAGKGRTYNAKTLSAYEALVLDTAEFVGRSSPQASGTQLKMLGAPRQTAINQVAEYSALEVYEALDDGALDPAFKTQLGNIVSNVTDKLFSALPNKFARGKADYSPEQIWDRALKSDRAPYVTAAIKAGFAMTAQEQFAVEALEVALVEATKAGSVSAAYRTVAKSFDEAKVKLTPADFVHGRWEDATAEQKQAAEQKYNYIFKVGQADYITRFTAMALANQEFNQLLNIKLSTDMFADRGQPAFDKLINMVNRAVNYTTERLTNTKGASSIQGKLPKLAELLIDIDLKNRNKATNKIEDYLIKTEDLANDLIIGVRNKANEAALNSPLTMFNNKYANIITNTLKATKDGRSVISVFDALRDFRNHENPQQRLGFMGELANEIGDQNQAQIIGERLLSYAKQNEGTAQRIRTVVKEDVLSRFKDKGANLTRESRAAVTQGLLRTDAQSLLDTYGYDGLVTLLTDRNELHKEIRKQEAALRDPIQIARTKSLGYYMVTGIGDETLAKNPTLIAQGAGMGIMTLPSQETIKQIDDLASLYALKYTDGKTLTELGKVIESEKDGVDGGGIYALVKYHESLAKESYETLFSRNIGSYTKGYMPNITNPHKEVVVATTIADKERLRSAMYTELGEVNKAAIDPSNSNTAVMFYTEDAGNQRHVSGAMALYNYGRKGTEIDLTDKELIDAINAAVGTLDLTPNFHPGKRSEIRAIPTYDTSGNIMAFNYEMSGRTRDTYLERNNDFSEIIGEYTAAGFNKVTLSDQNINVADALIEQYRSDYSKDPKAYIYVGAGVQDEVLAQSWAMIPQEIRQHIYARTGNNGIYVHNQAYLTIFGAKKYSLTSTFDKYQDQQNMTEQLFTGFMKAMFRDNARLRTAQGERMWQEAVHLLKDFVIIRNMSTALVNIISNSFLLMAHGVSPVDIVRNTVEAVKAGGEYRKNSAELIKMQNRQRVDIGNADEIQQRINILQQRIDKNPLKNFIDEGMFAGIVEDIDTDNQSYTYMSGLEQKYEGMINSVPKTVRMVARHAFVQPGTPLYQFLHSTTQYGDFAAKYSMYKHYTEKAKVKLTHEQAITKASNNFINYDVPTSQGMQYANDMGLLMFTKYNLRIQRALFELMGKRPASVIGQAIAINALTNLPPGIDPMVFNQIGNPLRNGPLGMLGAWDEPFPIQMVKSMF